MKKQSSLLMLLGLMLAATFTVSAQNVCSKQVDDKEVAIKVINKTDKPFTVNWVDHECKESQSDQEVAPGETFEGISYNGHAFRVREIGSNKLLQVIVVNPSKPVTTVNAPTNAAVKQPSAPLPSPAAQPPSAADRAIIKVFIDKPTAQPCSPEPGWAKCLELPAPAMKIFASKAVSQSALNGVANVYAEMTQRFRAAKYPLNKLDGYKVYITNGEPWAVLSKLNPVGTMWPDQTGPMSGNFLRGGSGGDYLWIEEQMICKRGVKTRNADGTPDDEERTFDQVVHEFAHTIDSKYIPDQSVNLFGKTDFPAVEGFAWGIQHWFGTPGGTLSPRQEAVLKDIFTSRTTFSCEGYKP